MRSVYFKILLSFLLILALNLAVSAALSIRFIRQEFDRTFREDLLANARIVVEWARSASGLGSEHRDDTEIDAALKQLGREMDLRLTLVARDGTVVADSVSTPSRMDNHAERPEIREALAGATGYGVRLSPTLGAPMTYLALPLRTDDGRFDGVVRVSMRNDRVGAQVVRMVYVGMVVSMAFGTLIAALASLFVARLYSRPIRLVRDAATRISGGDFKHRLKMGGGDEFSRVAEALNEMSDHLGRSFKQLRREKERNATILDGLNEEVLFVGPDNTLLLVNAACRTLLELEDEDALERDYREVVANEDVRQFIDEAMRSATPTSREIAVGSGLPRHYRLSSSPIHSRKGRLRGLVVIFHDVQPAKEVERMRREFLDSASHELKTPISAVFASAETLLEREPPASERRAKFYKAILDNAERLNNLITDMLDLSEIEQKKASLEIAPCDIGEIVREVLGPFWPEVGKKNHRLEIETPAEPVAAPVDRKSLAKALGNLVENAIRYTEPGGRLHVRLLPDGPEGPPRIEVEDTGIGIPPQDLQRIFERFYRVDKARSLRDGGTGLGLAIVKHIMEAMGGKVAVVSKPGRGSRFTLVLPTLAPSDARRSTGRVLEVAGPGKVAETAEESPRYATGDDGGGAAEVR